jgi:hypothetical protein
MVGPGRYSPNFTDRGPRTAAGAAAIDPRPTPESPPGAP